MMFINLFGLHRNLIIKLLFAYLKLQYSINDLNNLKTKSVTLPKKSNILRPNSVKPNIININNNKNNKENKYFNNPNSTRHYLKTQSNNNIPKLTNKNSFNLRTKPVIINKNNNNNSIYNLKTEPNYVSNNKFRLNNNNNLTLNKNETKKYTLKKKTKNTKNNLNDNFNKTFNFKFKPRKKENK